MGKDEIVWSVPVAEVQQPTLTIFEKRSSYYGVVFPSLCCVCGEAPGTIAHEIMAVPLLDKGTYTMNAPWCQKCADEYAALEEEWKQKPLKPIAPKWLGIAFLFGVIWWLTFGFIQPGILPAIGATIWMTCIIIYVLEFIWQYRLHSRQIGKYQNAIKIKGVGRTGIIHPEKRLIVSFKNEKYSEAFGKANPHASIVQARKK